MPVSLFSMSSSSLQNLFEPPSSDKVSDEGSSRTKVLSDIPEGSEGSGGVSRGSNIDESVAELTGGSEISNVKKTIGNDSGSLGFRFFDQPKVVASNKSESSNEEHESKNYEHNNSDHEDNKDNDNNLSDNTLDNSISPEDSTTSSPFKVFQKSNTYTKGRLEHLLGSLDSKDDQTSTSSTLRHLPDSIKSLRNGGNVTGNSTIASHEGNKLTDYISQADALMNDLRNRRPHVPDFSNSTSSIISDSSNSDYTNSLNELEYSLKQHSPEMDSDDDTRNSSSTTNSSKDETINQQANYYNSVKGRFEKGSTSINIGNKSSVVSGSGSGLGSNSDSSSISLNEYQHGDLSNQSVIINQKPSMLNHIPENVQPFHSPQLSEPSESSSQTKFPGSPNKRHPAMAVITPDDLKDFNENFEGIVWDEVNRCWRKNDSPDFGTGTTKVASSDDKDPFEGIDDLDDSSKIGTENWALSEVIPNQPRITTNENQNSDDGNSTPNALQGLEEIPEVAMEEIEDIVPDHTLNSPQSSNLTSSTSSNVVSPISSQSPSNKKTPSNISVLPHNRVNRRSERGYNVSLKSTPQNSTNRSDKITVTSSYSQVNKREVSFQISREDAKKLLLQSRENRYFPNIVHTPVTPRVNATSISIINSSFSDVYNSMVKILTEDHPNEDWSELLELSVSGYNFTTLLELEKLCPNLEILDASKNRLNVINGVPSTLLNLNASNNQLTKLVSFKSLTNLQQLNLSNNKLDSLFPLSGLIHLTELNVDNNSLTSLFGIDSIRGLRSLSARNNKITVADFQKSKWAKLEEMYLSGNQLELIKGLHKLTNLVALDLDNNKVVSFSSPTTPYRSIRKLLLNGNDTIVDISMFKGLKELQFDRNKRVIGLDELHRLEVLTLRNQTETTHINSWEGLCDIRRLHLSGNRLERFTIREPFLNLQVLELSGASLTTLPEAFFEFCLNLRELDLSFNRIKSLRPLVGIPKLKRLYLYHNDISDIHELVECISSMPYLEVLDTRGNPINEKFYPPLSVDNQESYRKTHTKREQQQWEDRVQEFDLTSLSDKARRLRTVYRGTLMGSSSRGLKWLDGAVIKEEEMIRALNIVKGVN